MQSFDWLHNNRMLMCRVMREGPEGLYVRNQLCNRLWEDARMRLKKMSRV